jgi:hypothetical protein
MKQKLWSGSNLDTTFPGDQQYINAHNSGYTSILDNFHSYDDSVKLSKKNHNDLIDFFKPLHLTKLGIHRLASYNFIKVDFKKYFSNFIVVLIKPDQHRLDVYGERFDRSTLAEYHTQWWAKNLKKKNFNEIPKFFLEKMSIKEKQKYIKNHIGLLDNFIEIDQKNTIVFDPDDIVDPNLLQQMIDRVCDSIGIENFEIRFDEIKEFIRKNKKYLK